MEPYVLQGTLAENVEWILRVYNESTKTHQVVKKLWEELNERTK
jgi:hypothetical protein